LSTSQRLTGAHLRSFVFQEQNKIPAIAENFIYQKSIIMISGDPGVGKSTINANIIRDLSEGVPVFNFFYVPKPVLVYYIPFERGNYEVADRLRALSSVIEPNWHNIIINPDYIGWDLFDGKQAKAFTDEVVADLKEYMPIGMEIVVMFDPIISMVSGEIKEEKYAKAITRCANIIQTATNCAMILTNHTIKNASTAKGKPTKVDPFYGSQAFKAFCTYGVHVSRDKERGGVNMVSTKSSHGNVIENIHLNYDAFTYSLFAKTDNSSLKCSEKVLAVVRAIRASGVKNFTFTNITKHPLADGMSQTSAKEVILYEEPFKSGIKPITGVGKATVLQFTDSWI